MACRRRADSDAVAVMKSNTTVATAMDEAPAAALVWGLTPREGVILAAILVASTAVYLPSLRNGWVFDDWEIFVNNKYLHSFWSFIWNSFRHDAWWFRNPKILPESAYYRPVENAFIAVGALLLGNHPVGWHLAKIALQLVTVVLSFRAAQLLSGEVAVGLLTAAIFGLMPAHVDAVVWVSALSEPLSTAFALGALCCFISRKPGWSRGMLSALALYACALLTHETAVLFPLIVASYVFLIERGANQRLPRSSRNAATIWNRSIAAARVCVPFAVLALAYLCVRIMALGFAFTRPQPPPPSGLWQRAVTHHIGAADYLLTWPVVLMTDLGVLAVPGIAGPVHNVNWITQVSAISSVAAGVVVIFAALALALILRSSSFDRHLYLFCAAWSLLALAPAMKLDSVWAPVQDRYLYSVSFGWSLALAVAATRLAATSRRVRAAVGTAMALLLAAYMASAIRIEHYWHDDVTFFEQCVAVDPVRPEYRRRLTDAMDKVGDYKGAARALEEGVKLDPNDSYLHLRLQQEYMRLGRVQDFEREFNAMLPPLNAAENSTNPGGAP